MDVESLSFPSAAMRDGALQIPGWQGDVAQLERMIHPDGYMVQRGNAQRNAPIDDGLLHPRIAMWLAKNYASGVYLNQKMMIEASLRGQSVIATTRTASGKSLGFMVPAFHEILSDPHACVIVYYPLRALGQDQTAKWMAAAKELGIDPELVQKIDGSVLVGERADKLNKARIILSTEDAIQSWYMSGLAQAAYQRVLLNTRLRIIDEVQALDGIFGTNCLYLFRRFDFLQSLVVPDYNPAIHRRYIGASGTLNDPEKSFALLTGVKPVWIDESRNGAPSHDKHIVHLQTQDDLHYILANYVDLARHQMVIFADSRSIVEELANDIAQELQRHQPAFPITDDTVIPYKSGLPAHEYERIHRAINSGRARVVVSTSALEAGVDVEFTFGANIGLPVSKSSLEQRIGRIGRRAPSTFFVFSRNSRIRGQYNLGEYLRDAPMETPTLYPHIPALQISAAQCLIHEMKAIEGIRVRSPKDSPVIWTRGFNAQHERARNPDARFAAHERHLIPPKARGIPPQRHLPLRSIPTERFSLKLKSGGSPPRHMGDVSAEQALRLYSPGSIVRHMGQRCRVHAWQQEAGGNFEIIMSHYKGKNHTRVFISERVRMALRPKRIIGKQISITSPQRPIEGGFICNISMSLNMTAGGFVEHGYDEQGKTIAIRPHRYMDDYQLEQTRVFAEQNLIDYGPKRHINYETIGSVIYLPEAWFGIEARKELGERLLRAYCDKNRISPNDVAFATKAVSVSIDGANTLDNNLLVFYERTGNRVGLLNDFNAQLRTLLLAIRDDLDDELVKPLGRKHDKGTLSVTRITNLLRFVGSLSAVTPDELHQHIRDTEDVAVEMPEGYTAVLEPGSFAKVSKTRRIKETVKIIMPEQYEGTIGYKVQVTNRKRFYDGSARWVTVRQSASGMIYRASKGAANDNAVGSRFIPASRVNAEIRRPTLAMHNETGKLFSVRINAYTNSVILTPYEPPQGDAAPRAEIA